MLSCLYNRCLVLGIQRLILVASRQLAGIGRDHVRPCETMTYWEAEFCLMVDVRAA